MSENARVMGITNHVIDPWSVQRITPLEEIQGICPSSATVDEPAVLIESHRALGAPVQPLSSRTQLALGGADVGRLDAKLKRPT